MKVGLPFSSLTWRRGSTVLILENHIVRTKSSVQQVSWDGELLHLHLVVHESSWWASLTRVWLVLLSHTGCLLLTVLRMLWRTALHVMLLLRRLTLGLWTLRRHLSLHHHRIDALHLLRSHSHLVLVLVSWIGITSSLMLATWPNWSLRHHLARHLLLRSRLWLLWQRIVHFD